MNFKLITLVTLVVLSIFLFIFISYSELQDGFATLVTGSPISSPSAFASASASVIKNTLSDGLVKTMKTIDKIV